MSLINDALKRAKKAQEQNPFGDQPAVPIQPADHTARRNYFRRSALPLLAVAALASVSPGTLT